MAVYGVLALAALICQASSQLFNGPRISNIGLPLLQPVQQISQVSSVPPRFLPLSNGLCCNSITNPTPVIPTTIIDNTVANSLANTLQLLIVSELLESTLNPTPCVSPFVSNIVPLYDAIGTIGTAISPLEVFAPSLDVAAVSYSPVVDVTTVVSDVVTAPVSFTQAPINTNLVTEVVSPVTTYSQNIYAPVTEVIAPAPVTSSVTNVYGSAGQVPLVTEVTSAIAPIPSVDVYTTINDYNTVSVVNSPANPYYIPSPTNCVAPVPEISYLQLPSPVSFAPIDVATPISFISDYYAGYADVVTPVPTTVPYPAEIILPQSIPAQIRCSFGYSPVNVPYLNMNVEPLSPCSGLVY